MFGSFVTAQLVRVKSLPEASMLSDKVFEKLEASLRCKVDLVAGSTYNRMISLEVVDNPLGASLPGLLTKEERRQALARVTQKLDSGKTSLPEPLVECLTTTLENACDAFIEAVGRLVENREEICRALSFDGPYHTIVDVSLAAGDTHNHGRSVMVFHTDAGTLVYKPHDLRVDDQIYGFVERFFPGFVGIPRSVAFGRDFGVCEFIEKRRAEGDDEAKRFWYNLGGLTAFAKLFGSTDLHFQNILCHGTVPYLIDLETILAPVDAERAEYLRLAKTREGQMRSPALSLLMPAKVENLEMSVLMNTDKNGIAPVVDGEVVTVRPYADAFKEGYGDACRKVVREREAVRATVSSFGADLEARVVLRPTRGYWEILKKLYHHTALASAKDRQRSMETLERLLRGINVRMDDAIIDSEVEQLKRGDVPYFYTLAGSLSLFGDGRMLVENKFALSAIDHALDILDAMGEADLSFDLAYIDRSIGHYPEDGQVRLATGLKPKRRDVADVPLSAEVATREAKDMFDHMHSLGIQAPNGRLLWGYVRNTTHSFQFGGAGLFDGLTGLSVFAGACAAVWPDEGGCPRPGGRRRDRGGVHADRASPGRARRPHSRRGGKRPGWHPQGPRPDEAHDARRQARRAQREGPGAPGAYGLWGLLRAGPHRGPRGTHIYPVPIRGISQPHHDHRQGADRLVELKTFEYKDHVLWKTMHRVPRVLSGAGHGMAGIAEALYAAADVCGDDSYVAAANDALAYEIDAWHRYVDKFGTWADLREFPPTKYMHGYCAGAPGTGIVLNRLVGMPGVDERVKTVAGLAHEAVERLPLNAYDHLCCGNSAIVEYYLSTGDTESAGRVLGALYERKQATGSYRDAYSGPGGNVCASLFNGICGIGYEMLRYAFPERLESIL